jgi:hypothetical protein
MHEVLLAVGGSESEALARSWAVNGEGRCKFVEGRVCMLRATCMIGLDWAFCAAENVLRSTLAPSSDRCGESWASEHCTGLLMWSTFSQATHEIRLAM